ncbi:MAG TPA: sigma-70 family RNA polymerase sigma factor [Planctomycetota bacterium]|nr:sigma-70 family RNA polymerase sigma factor [Planctomycetota bacterium]
MSPEPPPAPVSADPGLLRPILDEALRGDHDSLHALVELLATAHYRRIVGFLRKHSSARTQTIEVAFQDSMVHFHELAEAGEVDIRGDVLNWVMFFCLRTLRNTKKARKTPAHDRNWKRMTAVLENLEARDFSGPATMAVRHEAQEELRHAVEELPPRMKEVLDLHLKGMTPDEIAAKLGIAVKTVYDIQEKAKLRVLLELTPPGTAPLPRPAAPRKDARAAAFIKSAVSALPPAIRRVIEALHFRNETEEASRSALGLSEMTLRELRDEGYRLLSRKLGIGFPEAFKSLG